MESAAAMMKLQASICQQKQLRLLQCHGRGRRSGSGAVLVRCSAGRNGSPRQLRVAYEGVPGSFSETAARKAFPAAGCHAIIIPCDSLESAFQDSLVGKKMADRAVVPGENHDLLLRRTLHGRLHIVGEVLLPVRHCLLALPGVRRESLARVISHPLALAQCEHTLDKMTTTTTTGTGHFAREIFSDTAGAAAHVAANGLRNASAVASARAAELYGLEVLADGIHDDDDGVAGNVTRFVVLARELVLPPPDGDGRPCKTSIVFADDHEEAGGGGVSSVIFKVIAAFAQRDISVTRIESRPKYHNVDTRLLGRRMFCYLDFQASLADPHAQNAMAEVHEFTSFLQVRGSYPMAMDDTTP